ncbi:DUF6492 family protein [Pseudooceanicola nanhaiensis]|uniref:DUF6492 family protein n=1 Tax=Pseudooceanicola nanhaiensis TaxID=375761 RepID=UPI00405A44A1
MTGAARHNGSGRDLTFVTITFREELELLRLQARSMAAFLPPDMVGEILVVVNDRDEAALGDAVEAMRAEYGALSGRLRVIPATRLFRWNVGPRGPLARLRRVQALHPRLALRSPGTAWRGHGGWKIQQVCKLAIWREVSTPWTVLLDSKIHFMAPVPRSEFFAPDGRPRMICKDLSDARMDWLAPSFAQFGLPPDAAGPRVADGIMPLPVATALLRDVTEAVEAKSGPLQVLFAVHRKGETEAMLITAHCIARHGSLEAVFDTARPLPPVIMRSHDAAWVDAALDAVEQGAVSLALHRAAVARLTQAQRTRLAGLWRDRGLVGDAGDLARIFSVRDGDVPAAEHAA